MFGLGMGELVIILVLVVLLFGSKKIPELAKGIGQGMNEFKKSFAEVTSEEKDDNKKT
jgi:TatA/E family protein of Tat protein translocase